MQTPGFFHYSTEMGDSDEHQLVFLHNSTQEEWQSLMAIMQLQSFEEGDYIMRQGDIDECIFFIASGKLQVSINLGDNVPHDIAVLGEGAIFGEQAFFDRLPRSATVQGIEAGEIYRLSRGYFDSLAARQPELGNKILFEFGRILSSRLRRATKLLSQTS